MVSLPLPLFKPNPLLTLGFAGLFSHECNQGEVPKVAHIARRGRAKHDSVVGRRRVRRRRFFRPLREPVSQKLTKQAS